MYQIRWKAFATSFSVTLVYSFVGALEGSGAQFLSFESQCEADLLASLIGNSCPSRSKQYKSESHQMLNSRCVSGQASAEIQRVVTLRYNHEKIQEQAQARLLRVLKNTAWVTAVRDRFTALPGATS
jgi:hypothetical protein